MPRKINTRSRRVVHCEEKIVIRVNAAQRSNTERADIFLLNLQSSRG